MKKITITFSFKQLMIALAGIFISATIYSFTSNDNTSSQLFSGISVETANEDFNRNRTAEPAPYGGDIWGFSITLDQFEAMKYIKRKENVAGFRCYFAKNGEGTDISIVVGMDGENNDIASNIQSAGVGSSGESSFGYCPTVCDDNSPITAAP